eukprot:COSAG01_NODE_10478_length_2156_cov_887.982013_2_plen_77_part_00
MQPVLLAQPMMPRLAPPRALVVPEAWRVCFHLLSAPSPVPFLVLADPALRTRAALPAPSVTPRRERWALRAICCWY